MTSAFRPVATWLRTGASGGHIGRHILYLSKPACSSRHSSISRGPQSQIRLSSSSSSIMASATTIYDFKPLDKKSQPVSMSQYANKVLLIVNTASKCGFTPQFGGLESLYQKVRKESPNGADFEILGFPCNQFGAQDPGSDDEIQQFCQLNYGVSFPMMAKTEVNGANANPLFEYLKAEKPGVLGIKRVKWNFEKWLVGRDGQVKQRWASTTKPEDLEKTILAALADKGAAEKPMTEKPRTEKEEEVSLL